MTLHNPLDKVPILNTTHVAQGEAGDEATSPDSSCNTLSLSLYAAAPLAFQDFQVPVVSPILEMSYLVCFLPLNLPSTLLLTDQFPLHLRLSFNRKVFLDIPFLASL